MPIAYLSRLCFSLGVAMHILDSTFLSASPSESLGLLRVSYNSLISRMKSFSFLMVDPILAERRSTWSSYCFTILVIFSSKSSNLFSRLAKEFTLVSRTFTFDSRLRKTASNYASLKVNSFCTYSMTSLITDSCIDPSLF